VFISLTCQHVVCQRRPIFRRRKMLNFYLWLLYFSTFFCWMTLRRIRNHGLQRTHGHGSRSSNGITHGHRNGLPVLVAAATFAGDAQRSSTAAAAWNILQRSEHIRRAVFTFHVQFVGHPIPLASHRSFLQRRKVRYCSFIYSGRMCWPISGHCWFIDLLLAGCPYHLPALLPPIRSACSAVHSSRTIRCNNSSSSSNNNNNSSNSYSYNNNNNSRTRVWHRLSNMAIISILIINSNSCNNNSCSSNNRNNINSNSTSTSNNSLIPSRLAQLRECWPISVGH
jgi:hypothetical protein